MSKNKISKREKQIMSSMGLDLEFVKRVTEIGRLSGTNKYDVWIGREVSKDHALIERASQFQYIIDWAKKDKPDIFRLDFEQALEKSKEWHDNLKSTGKYRIFEDDKDENRVIYKSKDGNFFFILLNPDDLDAEGDIMRNCVGTYKDKVIKGYSLIISMRDMKNQPHVTIELDIKTSTVTQIRGKANTTPSKEYMKIITEFAVFASGLNHDIDEEVLSLIDLKI